MHYGKITCLSALFGVEKPRKRIAFAAFFALKRTKNQAILLESHLNKKPLSVGFLREGHDIGKI